MRINSVVDGEGLGFNPRVKCFPLYTIMLAVNQTKVDLLSLGCQGQELEVSKKNGKMLRINHMTHLNQNYDSIGFLSFHS